jgi:hypothetical protein
LVTAYEVYDPDVSLGSGKVGFVVLNYYFRADNIEIVPVLPIREGALASVQIPYTEMGDEAHRLADEAYLLAPPVPVHWDVTLGSAFVPGIQRDGTEGTVLSMLKVTGGSGGLSQRHAILNTDVGDANIKADVWIGRYTHARIVAKYQDEDNYYFMVIYNVSSITRMGLGKVENGHQTSFASVPMLSTVEDAWVEAEFKVRGGELSGIVSHGDGLVTAYEVYDPDVSLGSGKVGFVVLNYYFRADNIEIVPGW